MERLRHSASELEQKESDLFARIDLYFSPEAANNIRYAYDLACEIHAGDKYAGGPYRDHLLDVAGNCLDFGFNDESYWELISAAFLHDVLEKRDHSVILAKALDVAAVSNAEEALEALTNTKILSIVKPVSNAPLTAEQQATFGKTEKFDHYYEGVETRLFADDTGWESIVIKIADNLANVRKLGTKDWAGIVLDRTNKYWRLPDLFDELIDKKVEQMSVLSDEQLLHIANAINEIRTLLKGAARRVSQEIMLAHRSKYIN